MVTPATPMSDSPPWGVCTGQVVPGPAGREAKLVVVISGGPSIGRSDVKA